MDSWFLAAIHGTAGNERMVSEDPVRKLCLGKLKNIPAQASCVALVILQAALLNHHLVQGHESDGWWGWFAADIVVVIVMIAGFFLREWRLDKMRVHHKEETGFTKGLPFASLSWMVYVICLGVRISMIFKWDLEFDAEIGNLKITICLTAIICAFFTASHHHHHESLARRAAILMLVRAFTIDLLDTIDILDVLFETAIKYKSTFPIILEDIVLAITILNLLRPSFVLWSLFMDHFSSKRQSLCVKIIKAVLELVMVNLPLLIIRSYIAIKYDDFISVFLVKNILAIVFGIIEIYDCFHDRMAENYEVNTSPKDVKEDNSKPAHHLSITDMKLNDSEKGYSNTASF